MKIRRIFIIAAFLPLLWTCGGKEDVQELPPPVIPTPDNPDDQEDDPDDQGKDPGNTTPEGAWEANRGKIVTPSGSGWTSKTIREGITYYTFSGKDPVSNDSQQAFAIDLDLNNPKYAVKLTYTTPTVVTSTVHKDHNAIATMNAGYEQGSIYIRVDGKDKSAIPSTVIGSTGVRNWKSEAAFFCDGERGIRMEPCGELIRPYVHPAAAEMSSFITKQRNYYYNCTDKYLISSSPMLIDDFKPVGETFIDYSISNWSKLNSEEPQYHQRHRHPRTAVALTENNHFIMFVVDGRTNYSKGMSAKELTQFLVKNFNPRYALNMDGGGSTSLCVEGEGDASTHVVNYPCDNSKHDHAGERARDTHFIIVAK